MKKVFFLVSVAAMLSISAIGQIQMDNAGHVGIGGVPSNDRLTIRDQNSLISFVNGNNHSWLMGNYRTSPWNATNTFAIYDETSSRLLMEFRQDATYLHNRLVVGIGYGNIFRSKTGLSNGAANFTFNTTSPTDAKGFLFENSYSESSGFYGDGDFAVIWSPGDCNRLLRVYDEDGMVEKYYLDWNGVPYYMSDRERKENIEPIKGSLGKIRNLKGFTYDYIKTADERMKDDSILNGLTNYKGNIEDYRKNIEKKNCGFIAEELEQIIPEVVETDENGSKFVNYDGVIPFLVEAMKEQQQVIEVLQAEIQVLKGGTFKSTLNDPKISEAHKSTLNQNIPNPFSQSTVIEYTIAGNAKNAMICIYNMNGNQLKCIPINLAGHGNIVINGSELSAGMYIYSLIVDGQLIDTKRMVLTN